MMAEFKPEHVGGFRTRDETAEWYADILIYAPDMKVAEINQAILNRWSKSALGYIKAMAWRIAERKTSSGKG